MLRAIVLLSTASFLPAAAPYPAEWWPAEVEQALGRAGANRKELRAALTQAPTAQRKAVAFLIANMPERDLRSLSASFLLENVNLAYKVRDEVPWGKQIPEAIFLNDVLPYSNFDEPRDPWRKDLRALCLPLVKDCKTPAEAAQKLNASIFAKLKVRYSTGRKRANQSPKESIEQGLASCSGLSILLVDACRSVGVPARVAGTPLWANKTGNHTWVEVWDKRWHFTGAAEHDPNGLDRGWFAHNASQAKKDVAEHAIYAASFQRTKVVFPLVWNPRCKDVFAENVTERYTVKAAPAKPLVRVQVRVFEAGTKKRLALPVVIEQRRETCEVCRGASKSDTADLNDAFTADLTPGLRYVVRVGSPVQAEVTFVATGKEQRIDVEVPAAKNALTALQHSAIEKEAKRYFEASADKQKKWRFDADLEKCLAKNEPAVRAAVWKAYREAAVHDVMKKDFEKKEVRYGNHVSPYTVKSVGKKPAGGWPLVIAMHGGGGVPKEINDSQWKHMQIYYRDQSSVTGYQYVALRAPNNTWNGFYDTYVPPLISNLIRQFSLYGDVDPDKVFLMGYSHGGYGAFYIGPRIPDRFAAVHASAAAPSDADRPLASNLRNLRFTFMIGEKDTAYGRIERCKKFNEAVEKLQADNKDAYPVKMELINGNGHTGLPDRDKIKEVYPHRRNGAPRQVTWELLDNVIDRSYWLGVPKPSSGQAVEAKIEDNMATVTTRKVEKLALYLDARLVRFDKPLSVSLNGKKQEVKIVPSLAALCRTMSQRGDPQLASTCVVELVPEKE
jgi:transglutaminase-like putative cysteine protease/predicted esterase